MASRVSLLICCRAVAGADGATKVRAAVAVAARLEIFDGRVGAAAADGRVSRQSCS